jgi:predicted HicB family RNase H-like nuclease
MLLRYGIYEALVMYDKESHKLCGRITNIGNDVVTFQSTTWKGIQEEFKTSVDDYVEWCVELAA